MAVWIATIAACLLLLSMGFAAGKKSETPPSTPTITLTITPTISPTHTPTPTRTPIVQEVKGASVDNLLPVINAYRRSKGLTDISLSEPLCKIATERVGRMNHDGFDGYFKSQSAFRGMGEILQMNSPARDEQYLVNSGWANSPGHNAQMLNPSWTHGCGAVSGDYAIFIFGKK